MSLAQILALLLQGASSTAQRTSWRDAKPEGNTAWEATGWRLSLYRSIYLSIYLSIYPSIYRSIHLSIHLPIHPSIHPSIHPAFLPSIHRPTFLYLVSYPYLLYCIYAFTCYITGQSKFTQCLIAPTRRVAMVTTACEQRYIQ